MTVHEPITADIPAFEQITIPLSDGKRLTARLWRPAKPIAAKVPVVMEWIPYRQSDNTAIGDSMVHGYFAMNGIAAIRVDLRGSGNSDGTYADEYTRQEQDDAVEVIAWLAAQEWCNGNVGLIGISWGGFAGLQIAARRPPALKAIITACSTDDRYSDDVHFMGGVVLADGIQWGSGLATGLCRPPDPAHVGERWRDMWLERLESAEPPLGSWLAHLERDEFWKHGSICENYDDIDCAVFCVTGWADGYTDPVLRMMDKLNVPRKALIGSWTHMYPTWGRPGPSIGFLQEAMRWWKHWLLEDTTTGIMEEPMLRLWVGKDMKPHPKYPEVGGRWVAVPGWPNEGELQTFYLDDGRLSTAKVTDEAGVIIDTPRHCGLYAGEWCPLDGGGDGPEFQADNRADDGLSVCFDTPVLKEKVEVLGMPKLSLDIALDGPAAMLAVRLNEVQPDGTSTRITFGLRRVTLPPGVKPGERFKLDLEIKGVAYEFSPGNRIRLALSTSFFPMALPEPVAGGVTIYPVGCSFALPAMPANAIHELPAFGEPVFAPPIPSEVLGTGWIERVASWEAVTGEARLTINSERRKLKLGELVMGGHGSQLYSVMPKDGSSYRCTLKSTQTMDRPGWSVRMEAKTELGYKDGHLTLSAQLDAFESDKRIFSRNRHYVFPKR